MLNEDDWVDEWVGWNNILFITKTISPRYINNNYAVYDILLEKSVWYFIEDMVWYECSFSFWFSFYPIHRNIFYYLLFLFRIWRLCTIINGEHFFLYTVQSAHKYNIIFIFRYGYGLYHTACIIRLCVFSNFPNLFVIRNSCCYSNV